MTTPPKKGLLKSTVFNFFEHDCPMMAAALAYFMVFSLPSLLVLLVLILGLFVSGDQASTTVRDQLSLLLGPMPAETAAEMLSQTQRPGGSNLWLGALSLAGLAFGASGIFVQLQNALNSIWEAEAGSERGMILSYLRKRGLSFAMLLAIAFLLLVSIVLGTAFLRFAEPVAGAIGLPAVFTSLLGLAINLALTTVLFAAVFAVLPDAEVAWKNVWFGALVTTLLFVAGYSGVTLYFNVIKPGSSFQATGSLAMLLVWVYFNALLVLIGAEFTRTWSKRMRRKSNG